MREKLGSLSSRDVSVRCVLVALVLLGMALRLYDLDADSLWLDEILTAERVQLDIPSLLRMLSSGAGGTAATQAPLTYVLTHACTSLLGHNEFTLRFQAMLLGTLSILLIYKLGVMLWSPTTGLLGAFLLAINAHHVEMSQEARHYGLMMFLALLSLIFLVRALRTSQARDWIGFVLCTSLTLYTHYFALLLVAGEALVGALCLAGRWLASRRERGRSPTDAASHPLPGPLRQTASFVASLTVLGLSFLPWVPVVANLASRQGGAQAFQLSVETLRASLDFLWTVLTTYSAGRGATLLVWIVLLLLGLATANRRQLSLVLPVVAMPFLFVAVTAPEHAYRAKYVIFLLPLYLLLVGQGTSTLSPLLARLGQRVGRHLSLPTPVLAALSVVLFSTLAAQPLSAHYTSEKNDWRSAAQFLAAELQPGDVILADGDGYELPDHRRVVRCLPYYLDRYGADAVPTIPIRHGLGRLLEARVSEETGEVWAVIYHLRPRLGREDLDVITVTNFRHVAVVRLRDPSGDFQQDTLSMLAALLGILPSEEAHFDVRLALADIYLQRGELSEAASQLEQAGTVMPGDSEAGLDLAQAYCDLGQAYEERGSLGTAELAYERALFLDPSSVRASRLLNEARPVTQ
jgi:4-amino-4-deoxy-L-arabinose transferase-like glycosyltransferase